jgi:hypothetical protein
MKKKVINIIIITIAALGILWSWNSKRSLSFEQAGTDFTKSFNEERKKMGQPIIPENWKNVNPLHYKIQVWENPDTTLPNYSEKTVVATPRAEFAREIDRYNLKKVDNKFYQIVIESDFEYDEKIFTLRKTNPPEKEGRLKGIRYSGEVIDTLSLHETKDTLAKYGLEILNY